MPELEFIPDGAMAPVPNVEARQSCEVMAHDKHRKQWFVQSDAPNGRPLLLNGFIFGRNGFPFI
jgi:hypothetical protein